MANDQDSSGEFRPFVQGTFKSGKYIQEGGQTTSPYMKGLKDLAYNNNTLLARASHQVINQVDPSPTATSIAWVSGDGWMPFAQYVTWIPHIPGRTTLAVKVRATAATSFEVRGVTNAGTSASSGLVATGGTATCSVTVTSEAFHVITLQFKMSANGNFTPLEVTASLTPITTTAIGTTVTADVTPQDVTMYTTDKPLPVVIPQDLARNNQYLYKNNVRCIQNWSYWGNWTSGVLASNVGLKGLSESGIYYKPRQGVIYLRVFMAGRVASGTGTIKLSFDNGTPLTTTLSTSPTVITDGNWACWSQLLAVPQGVPSDKSTNLKLRISGNNVRLQALSIWEDPNTIQS